MTHGKRRERERRINTGRRIILVYGVRVSWMCVKWQWGDQCARNMAEELVVTLNRGDSSGFGFSLLGTAGLPHVIYDIVENSPAAKSGKVSIYFDRIFYIFVIAYCLSQIEREVWEHLKMGLGKEQPQVLLIHTLCACRESCERKEGSSK